MKVARTVLKGEGGGNAADLLNYKVTINIIYATNQNLYPQAVSTPTDKLFPARVVVYRAVGDYGVYYLCAVWFY